MININISEKLLNEFMNDGFSIREVGSALLFLRALQTNDTSFINTMYQQEDEMCILVKNLYLSDFLEIEDFEEYKSRYTLSERGIKLLNYLKLNEKSKNEKKVEDTNDVNSWIQDWLNIWKDQNGVYYKAPSGAADGSQKRTLGCSKKDALDRMNSFFVYYGDMFDEEEKHTAKDIIIMATKRYIQDFKKTDFMYCRKATYFISKSDAFSRNIKSSDLATYCTEIIQELKTKSILDIENTIETINKPNIRAIN